MGKGIQVAAVLMACAGVSFNAVAEEKTSIGGKAYFDLSSIDQKSDGAKTAASGIGVDVKRFYVAIDHQFDDMWSADVTTDFNYVSNDSETQVFVKKAFVQAKVSDAVTLRAGSADLPWVPYVENLYGYRYVENTLIDRLKFGTSADWGVHLFGKMNMVNYAVSAVNGGGYKNPTRTKSMDFEGRIGVSPIEGLELAAGFYSGKLGKETETSRAPNSASRTDLLVAYKQAMYRVGAEYFSAENWSITTKDKADGYSLWGSVAPMEKVSVFARLDSAKPNKDTVPDLKDTYYNLGVGYQARKNVDLALVYKQEKVENGSISTSNGSIGGTSEGKYNEIGIWSQVVF